MGKNLEDLKELAENEGDFKSVRSQDFVIYYLVPLLEDFENRLTELEKLKESIENIKRRGFDKIDTETNKI